MNSVNQIRRLEAAHTDERANDCLNLRLGRLDNEPCRLLAYVQNQVGCHCFLSPRF